MSRRFEPHPKQRLVVAGEEYEIAVHPNAPAMPFVAEGGRARVVQLQHSRMRSVHALKVFKPRYRSAVQADIARGLAGFASVKGMQAARRSVIDTTDPAAKEFPDLAFAVVMPWILATTWFDILMAARAPSFRLERRTALRLAIDFLSMMETLEGLEFAHTDIAPGNVMVDMHTCEVHLLDLEDAYFPGANPPIGSRLGTSGYRHEPTAREGGLWSATADRHASAVLVAEMIFLSSPTLSGPIADTGLFAPHPQDPTAQPRVHEFTQFGRGVANHLTNCVVSAFTAQTMDECPTLTQLAAAARLDLAALPADSDTAVTWVALPQRPAPADARTDDVLGVIWETTPTDPKGTGRTQARPKAPTPARRPTGGARSKPKRATSPIAIAIVVVFILIVILGGIAALSLVK